MSLNQTATSNEYIVREGALLVSVTDVNGKIIAVSPEFIQVTGYSNDELIGKDHGALRHPDTPEAVYQDLWKTLRAGRPWTGLMKNRRKNGDYYWDIASVTPLMEAGVHVGFMTMRTKPSAQQIRETSELYQRLRDGSDKTLRLVEGHPVRTNWRESLNPLRELSDQARRWLDTVFGVLVLAAAAALLVYPQLPGGSELRMAVAVLLLLRCGLWVARIMLVAQRRKELTEDTVSFIQDLAAGHYHTTFKSTSKHKAGEIQCALLTLRIKMGYLIAEERRKASLQRQALDGASANIMLADENHRIVYTNASASRMFKEVEADFRKDLPGFQADKVIGSDIDVFHQNSAHQRQAIVDMTT